ncbi:MAG: hypothetical protein QOI25_1002 [Mycobacterium sp.]|jgi:hypothetical protein|nr:hypothetical protein [Mycobacterium sp.]
MDGLDIGRPGRSIEINGATARIWKYRANDPRRLALTIRWTLTAGHEIELAADGLSSTDLIVLARSMR